MNYSFTASDLAKAAAEWGCNCGPSALAFALQRRLDVARCAIPDFESKRYTSPTMMKKALETLRIVYEARDCKSAGVLRDMFYMFPALVRIQWTGPWTEPGANPRWAYRQTHWIVTWRDTLPLVFDCNGGIMRFDRWKREVVPQLTALYKNSDGGFYPTHVWRLLNKPQEAAT